MTRVHPTIVTVLLIGVPGAWAQTLTGLRIEGPNEVIENTTTLYTVIAEFDNGWEFAVTLDGYLWTDPGEYADVGVFGDF